MAKQTINIGTVPNDLTGDPLRVAFDKINQNFNEVYPLLPTADEKAALPGPVGHAPNAGNPYVTVSYLGAHTHATLPTVDEKAALQGPAGYTPNTLNPYATVDYVTQAVNIDGNKGDISVSGASWTINNGVVSFGKIQNIATARILGRVTAGFGSVEELTGAQVMTLLPEFTSLAKGVVPASGGGTTKYLRADGTWAVPPDTDTNTTYTVFTNLADGLAPASGGGTSNYLRADGTWSTPPNTTYSVFTSTINGLTPASGGGTTNFLRADGQWVSPSTYTVFTSVTDGLAPASGGGTTKYLRADGIWSTPPDTNTTYGVFTLSSNGLTPASGGGTTKYLRADGIWSIPPDTNTTYSVFTNSTNGLTPASGGGTTNFLRADGTWADPGAGTVVTAGNLLTKSGNQIQLGGVSTQAATTLTLANSQDFEIIDGSFKFGIGSNFGFGGFHIGYGDLVTRDGQYTDIYADPSGVVMESRDSDGQNVKFYMRGSGASGTIFYDNRTTKKGIEYAGSNYVTQPNSLTTKQYVDQAVAGVSTVTASQGLTKVGNDIKLGGTLTGGTLTSISSTTGNGIDFLMGSGSGTPTNYVKIAPDHISMQHYTSYPTVAVKYVMQGGYGIFTGPQKLETVPGNDDEQTQVLVRDSLTGEIKYRNASSFAGSGLSTGDKGDITVNTLTNWTIDNNVVTYAKMQDITGVRFLGRSSATTGDPQEITGTTATSMLNVFSSTLKGLVPASGGGTTNFLRADGTWAAPAGGGGGVTTIGGINGVAKSTNGAVISGTALYMQHADATYSGLVSTAAQIFAGNKTFNGDVFVGGSSAPRLELTGLYARATVGSTYCDFSYTGVYHVGTGTVNLKSQSGNVQIGAESAGKYTQLINLPTSDPLVTGALWNSAGTVKISAGP